MRRGARPSLASGEILLVLRTNTVDVASKIRLGYCRKQRHAVLLAFAARNHDLVQSEVGVLDAQTGAFEEPQVEP